MREKRASIISKYLRFMPVSVFSGIYFSVISIWQIPYLYHNMSRFLSRFVTIYSRTVFCIFALESVLTCSPKSFPAEQSLHGGTGASHTHGPGSDSTELLLAYLSRKTIQFSSACSERKMSLLRGVGGTDFHFIGHSFFLVLDTLFPCFVLFIGCFAFSFYSIAERKIPHRLLLFPADVSVHL